MPEKKKYFYDIEELKGIRITDILRDYGIPVNKGFFKLRNERTASCKVYESTNSFYDFGGGIGGNAINLIEYIEQCSRKEAMEKLADMYGIEPVNKDSKKNKEPIRLSDSQYALIGIAGDRASKNILFDMEKSDMDFERMKSISEKYALSMNDLKKKNLTGYEAIIGIIAFDTVDRKREAFKCEMYMNYAFRNLIRLEDNLKISSVPEDDKIAEEFRDMQEELNRTEKVLETACKGCKTISFKAVKHDAVAEYHKMVEEMDVNLLYEILEGKETSFDEYSYDNGISPLPKEHNDYSRLSHMTADKILESGQEEKQRTISAPVQEQVI